MATTSAIVGKAEVSSPAVGAVQLMSMGVVTPGVVVSAGVVLSEGKSEQLLTRRLRTITRAIIIYFVFSAFIAVL
jgi:hypothetical protein